MKTSIIKIGNSQGIRIPKPILDQCGFDKEVVLEVINQELILKAPKMARKGWEASFRKMAENGDDQLFDSPISTEWDEAEWEWE